MTWSPAVEVDASVDAVSTGSGASVLDSHDRMNLVYQKDDDIYLVHYDGDSWSSPEQVSDDPALSVNPQLAAWGDPEVLHVVWEDERSGVPEVWTRRWDGSSWSAEECLTCYAGSETTRSAAPSIGERYVAWEEGTAGSTAIVGRPHDGTSWQPAEPVSQSPGSAAQPALTSGILFSGLRVAWIDARHGGAHVYVRDNSGGGWGMERVLPTNGSVVRIAHHAEPCCGDVAAGESLVAVEEPGSTSLILVTDSGEFVLDVFAASPSVGGYTYPTGGCAQFGGPLSSYLVGQTYPSAAPGVFTHEVFFINHELGALDIELLSNVSLGDIAVGAREAVPDAELIAAWIEERNGVPTLVAAEGGAKGGDVVGVHDAPASFLITPGNTVPMTVYVTDLYGGEGQAGWDVFADLTGGLAAELTFDEGVTEPFSATSTAPDGAATFAISGGGCSQAGQVILSCGEQGLVEEYSWNGVRSPDIDGDCVVDELDRLYVEEQQGTDDFCADLDGSGLVDVDDYNLVNSLVGTQCATVDVGEPTTAPAVRRVIVTPNPASGAVTVSVSADLHGAEAVVYDVVGRRVRALGTIGASGVLAWDTRDADGARVATGRYFVRIRTGEVALVRAVSVVR